jgi:hypothetical protein
MGSEYLGIIIKSNGVSYFCAFCTFINTSFKTPPSPQVYIYDLQLLQSSRYLDHVIRTIFHSLIWFYRLHPFIGIHILCNLKLKTEFKLLQRFLKNKNGSFLNAEGSQEKLIKEEKWISFDKWPKFQGVS